MIHYHGGPITPLTVADAVWRGRHAFVSFERPEQVAMAAAVCQSFALDNGAFSAWTNGATLDVQGYAEWVREWMRHPGFDWCLIPDVIDGTENDNAGMIAQWRDLGIDFRISVPVWHMHESLTRLAYMAVAWPRIAIGSSGEYATVGTSAWWHRMGEAMTVLCDGDGRPKCKLHGLRMLNPEVFTRLPLASADSTNVARNHARETQRYRLTDGMGAIVVTGRVEANQSAATWQNTGAQLALESVA
ncbi:MAG: hypothetical protein ACK5X3_04680 [Pseudomonadota bacterium]